MDTATSTDPGSSTGPAPPLDQGGRNDAALLQLIWLASPALPVGGFAYSEGLEAAVEAGMVKDEHTAAAWIADQLHLTLARADLAVLSHAVRAVRAGDEARLRELDAWVLRTRETAELRLQTEQMGRSLGEWQRSLDQAPNHPHPDAEHFLSRVRERAGVRAAAFTYPVAFAQAAAPMDAPVRDILLAFAFGWSENMMQAAIKSVPLGQGAGQRILARLAREIPAAADHALALRIEDMQSFSPMLAILSARHETQYSRLFRS